MPKIDIYIENEYAMPLINLDEGYEEGWNDFISLLPITPEVVDYSNFGYTPNLGDFWNGQNFISASNSDFISISAEDRKWFAIVKDGIVKWIFGFPITEQYEPLEAALLSNPTFKLGS